MRLILIPAIVLALLSTGMTSLAAGKVFDTRATTANDGEQKKDQENSEGKTTGDDEPDCE